MAFTNRENDLVCELESLTTNSRETGLGMSDDLNNSILKNKLIKDQYGELFDRVASLLYEVDPIGINLGNNPDEYEPEVRTILPRLTHSCTVQDVEKIIYEEFCQWFGDGVVGSRENYLPIAEKVLKLWHEFNQTKP